MLRRRSMCHCRNGATNSATNGATNTRIWHEYTNGQAYSCIRAIFVDGLHDHPQYNPSILGRMRVFLFVHSCHIRGWPESRTWSCWGRWRRRCITPPIPTLALPFPRFPPPFRGRVRVGVGEGRGGYGRGKEGSGIKLLHPRHDGLPAVVRFDEATGRAAQPGSLRFIL